MIFIDLFLTFFKIGAFTFGGGYAMLPLIQEEVLAHAWMDATTLTDFIAVSESTPGPFAINISTFIGTTLASVPGAICATLGVVLPSFTIILIVAKFFMKFKENRIVIGCMSGLRPAVIGLIAAAIISVSTTVFDFSLAALRTPALWISAALFGICTFLAFKKVHPIVIILLAAGVGIIAGYTVL